MNLNYGQINESKNTLIKLLHTNAITNFNEIIEIGEFEDSLNQSIKICDKAYNGINSKYAKMAEVRKNTLYPQGHNTTLEVDSAKEEKEKLDETICSISIKLPVLSQVSVEAMFNDEDKAHKLTAYDLAVLKKLKMLPKKEGK